MKPEKIDKILNKNMVWAIAILAVLLVLAALAVTMGRYKIGLIEFFAALLPNAFPDVEVPEAAGNVIFNIRLPRIGLAILAGAGLSVSGGAFQALFSNPLAAPDTLGVATGASFGAVLGILMGFPTIIVQALALLFGVLAVLLGVIIDGVLDRLVGQHGAVNLHRRQTAELIDNLLVGQRQRFFDLLADDHRRITGHFDQYVKKFC